MVDNAVLSKKQAAQLINISPDTLDRLHQRGDGPPRLQISDRRVGYRLRDLNLWLKTRAA